MNGTHKMRRSRIIQFEAEVSICVGLRPSCLRHSLAEVHEDDFVSGGGLRSGNVLDGAGEGLGFRDCGKYKNRQNEFGYRAVTFQCFDLRQFAWCLSRSLSLTS